MKRIKKAFNISVLIILFATIAITIAFNQAAPPVYAGFPGEPHDADAMWVEPSIVELSTDTHSVGYEFNVTVWINLTVACGGWQFKMLYNKTQLNALRCGYTAGTKSQFFENLTTFSLDPEFGSQNATHDFVLHGEVWFGGDFRNPGYGSFSWVEFEVMAAPAEGEILTSLLDISTSYHPPTSDTFAVDPDENEILLTISNGIYRFTSPSAPPPTYKLTISSTSGGTTDPSPGIYDYDGGDTATVTAIPEIDYYFDHWELDSVSKTENPINIIMNKDYTLLAVFGTIVPPPVGETILYIDPPEIIDPTLGPSSTFSINVTISNVTDLVVCKFNVTYDPDMISWVGLDVHKVEDQSPTPKMILDDEVGFLWIKLTYPVGVTTESSPLVTVEFHVDSYGCTVLDLHDTQLTNSTSGSITHVTQDGLFCTLIQDVAITNVQPSKDWVYEGWEVNINVTAKNKGNLNETFTVAAYYDGTEIGNLTINDLPSGNETIVVFTWNTEGVPPCFNYTITGRAEILPYEMNTTNNEYVDGYVMVRMLGDINGDGKVNVQDLFAVSKAFGSYPGHPRWDPDMDINQDYVINVVDLFAIAKDFGRKCPP
jgi:hypothetical protein